MRRWRGYQSIIVGKIRDPYLIRQLDHWVAAVRSYIDESVSHVLEDAVDRGSYSLIFHMYGINAVMGSLEPDPGHLPHESRCRPRSYSADAGGGAQARTTKPPAAAALPN